MSSSDSAPVRDVFPDWAAFAERDVPAEVEILSPAAEAAALLQRYHRDLTAADRAREDVRTAGLRALAQQAVFVFQLAGALERYQQEFAAASLPRVFRHLRVLKDQMLDGLAAAGLEVEVPLGRPFEAVSDRVHVDGWRHDDRFTREEVAEVIEPIVTSAGTVVRLGRVVMGAPPQRTDADGRPVGKE